MDDLKRIREHIDACEGLNDTRSLTVILDELDTLTERAAAKLQLCLKRNTQTYAADAEPSTRLDLVPRPNHTTVSKRVYTACNVLFHELNKDAKKFSYDLPDIYIESAFDGSVSFDFYTEGYPDRLQWVIGDLVGFRLPLVRVYEYVRYDHQKTGSVRTLFTIDQCIESARNKLMPV